MSTWSELKAFAADKYNLAQAEPDSFKVAFEYPNQRVQAVVVSRFQAADCDWCDLSAACCTRDRLAPQQALARNFHFAAGALSLDGDVYVVRYALPLELVALHRFELLLQMVASTAEQVEREVRGG